MRFTILPIKNLSKSFLVMMGILVPQAKERKFVWLILMLPKSYVA